MAQPEVIKDIDARVKKSGDTMTGNLQGKYFQGTWLQTTDITDLNSSSSKIAVISNDGWIYYRTPSELASDIGLTGNYVLKSGDIMTGNLTAPKFIGQLQGNASSSTYSTYTCFQDTRNVNEMPLDMLKGISLHLKSNSTDGLNDGLSYHPVLMLRDWNDLSGGPFAELTITGNQNLYFRSSTTNADNTWNPWRKVLTDYNYTSILNNTYLPLSGGTMAGSLNFANNTWNNVGDDVAIGDANVAGTLCVKGINGSPGIRLFDSSGNIVGDVYHTGKKPTPADIGAAASSHNHSATNITSGTLAVARGGTGQTTVTPAVGTKGVRQIYAGTSDMTAGSTPLTTGVIYFVYE